MRQYLSIAQKNTNRSVCWISRGGELGNDRRFSLSPEPSPNLSREKHPHPRRRRGLSRNIAGEARIKWRGTRHPNWGEGRERVSRGGEFWVIVAAPFSGGARLASKALDDLIVV